jgi:putative DNA methylase
MMSNQDEVEQTARVRIVPGESGTSENEACGSEDCKSGQDVRDPGSAGVSPAHTPNRGWHSRGYLPHFESSEVIQSITFRLADSLPANVVDAWQRQLDQLPEKQREVEVRIRIQSYLDAGYGECWLKDAEIANLVENALLHFDGQRYRMFAWCIMPNHVHVLTQFMDAYSMSSVLHSWKSFTAKQINRRLNRNGIVWHADYFDRFIRNEEHFYQAKIYIEDNPTKAGLCSEASHWKWSSASRI